MVKVRVKVMFRVQKDLGFDLYRHSDPFIFGRHTLRHTIVCQDLGFDLYRHSDPFIFGRHTVYLRHTHYEMLLALSRSVIPSNRAARACGKKLYWLSKTLSDDVPPAPRKSHDLVIEFFLLVTAFHWVSYN